jgi:hypothetical protein
LAIIRLAADCTTSQTPLMSPEASISATADQSFGAASRQRYFGAVSGEPASKMPAEAARAACHQDMLIIDFKHRHLQKPVSGSRS